MGHKKKHRKTKFPVETEHIFTIQKKWSAALKFLETLDISDFPMPSVPAKGLYVITVTITADRVVDAEHGTLAQELKALSHLYEMDHIIQNRSD
jgi:hypothetical protein